MPMRDAERRGIDLPSVVAVDGHAPGARRVQAQEQLEQGALAGTAAADERHRLPDGQVQVHVAQAGAPFA